MHPSGIYFLQIDGNLTKHTRVVRNGTIVHAYSCGLDEQEWSTCAVPCVYHRNDNDPADGAFGVLEGVPQIHRSMESSAYFPDNDLQNAHRCVLPVSAWLILF